MKHHFDETQAIALTALVAVAAAVLLAWSPPVGAQPAQPPHCAASPSRTVG